MTTQACLPLCRNRFFYDAMLLDNQWLRRFNLSMLRYGVCPTRCNSCMTAMTVPFGYYMQQSSLVEDERT